MRRPGVQPAASRPEPASRQSGKRPGRGDGGRQGDRALEGRGVPEIETAVFERTRFGCRRAVGATGGRVPADLSVPPGPVGQPPDATAPSPVPTRTVIRRVRPSRRQECRVQDRPFDANVPRPRCGQTAATTPRAPWRRHPRTPSEEGACACPRQRPVGPDIHERTVTSRPRRSHALRHAERQPVTAAAWPASVRIRSPVASPTRTRMCRSGSRGHSGRPGNGHMARLARESAWAWRASRLKCPERSAVVTCHTRSARSPRRNHVSPSRRTRSEGCLRVPADHPVPASARSDTAASDRRPRRRRANRRR